jgi:hypothetical protein
MTFSGLKEMQVRNLFQPTDERMWAISGRLATITLVLTQTALLVAILHRRFYLGQSEESYSDIKLILLGSIVVFIATRLAFGAVLPVLSFKVLAAAYLILAGGLFVVLSLWLGLPNMANWQNTILPVVLGPALLVGAYAALACWGQIRIEKELSED